MRSGLVAAAAGAALALPGCSDGQAQPQVLPPLSPAATSAPATRDVAGGNALAEVRFRVTPHSLFAWGGAVVQRYEPEEQRRVVAFNLVGGRLACVRP